jgi:hypothetical protein
VSVFVLRVLVPFEFITKHSKKEKSWINVLSPSRFLFFGLPIYLQNKNVVIQHSITRLITPEDEGGKLP